MAFLDKVMRKISFILPFLSSPLLFYSNPNMIRVNDYQCNRAYVCCILRKL